MTEKSIPDKDLGEVTYRRSARAKRYSIQIGPTTVSVVIPPAGNLDTAMQFFEESKAKVIRIQQKQKQSAERGEAGRKTSDNDANLLLQARAYLPGRLNQLAALHGFSYNRLTLRNSRTRWGSCSSKRNINLSIYLMTLPAHLIDYVILHELCHLTHLNHSPAFWDLLDRLTNRQAKALRKELKDYRCQ